MTTTAAALLFAGPGVALLAKAPHFIDEMARLGYPAYFPPILGVFKLLAAITLLVPGLPRLKEWAYAGMIFDALCAALSRASVRDASLMVLVPLGIAALTLASWALRTDRRKLPNLQST